MAEDQPQELMGWPESWYVPGDGQKVYLGCPASNCGAVFKTAKEVENRLEHHVIPSDYVMRFEHSMLGAMCYVTRCPKCINFVRTPRDMGPFTADPDIRALLRHEHDVHNTQDLIDVYKFVGFIRQNRSSLFGAKHITNAIHVWKEIGRYHRIAITKQPRYQELKEYLENECKLSMEGDWLGRINMACRDTKLPEEAKGFQLKECQDCYPVGRTDFLKQFKPTSGEKGRAHVWDVMRAEYFSGHI